MISHLHLINMSRKQTTNELCFLRPLSLMPILCHCCVKLQQTEGMVFNLHIALKKNCLLLSNQHFETRNLECELNCLHVYNQDMNNIAFVEHGTEETE